MKKTGIVLILFSPIFLGVGHWAFALSPQGVEKELQPLFGSDWVRDHPGTLPYEECHLDDGNGFSEIDHGSTSLLFVNRPNLTTATLLTCNAPSIQTSFSIPVKIESNWLSNYGIFLNFFGQGEMASSGHVAGLHGKRLGDLTGTYTGYKFGGGLIIGGINWVSVRNENGIKFSNLTTATIHLLELGRVQLEVSLAPVMSWEQCYDPFVLTGAPLERVKEGARECGDPNGESALDFNIPTSLKRISELRFQWLGSKGAS